MNFSHFFIGRPRFAAVLSILVFLAGLLALPLLPVSEYPEVVPPTITVRTNFPGANPEVAAETVASPLEQSINGIEGLLYQSSNATADGVVSLTATFELGTDVDNAQVQVQNRVAQALPRLPAEVQRIGVVTEKAAPDITLVVHLLSPGNVYDQTYLANYARLRVRDELLKLDGVGGVQVFGAGAYSMRVWLDPEKVAARGLTPGDVVRAIRAQNAQVAAGSLGSQQPEPGTNDFELLVNTQGRLVDEEQFADIVVRTDANGALTRVRDVGRVQLGANTYALRSYINNQPAAAVVINQRPGANAIAISSAVRETMAELQKTFPQGVRYQIAYDPTVFVRSSIEAVIATLLEATLLVVLVVILFLQTWRASVIPLVAVPVSLVGTLAVMYAAGFGLNALTLFGLVLAIGIVVDDAIVVVENVERNIEEGLAPREATAKAMREVTGPIVATALVLCAVFLPTAFITGLTGQFFRQFALTIAISTVISAFNSLTLSPALAAVLLKPHGSDSDRFQRLIDRGFGWLFRPFNRFFARGSRAYVGGVRRAVARTPVMLAVYAALVGLTVFAFLRTPGGFVPAQDKQYLVAMVQLPDAASLERTDQVMRRMTRTTLETPGVRDAIDFPGLSINGFVNSANSGISFIGLDDFDERTSPETQAGAIAGALNMKLSEIQDAIVVVFPPPPVQGIGAVGGFRLQIQDRDGAGFAEMNRTIQAILAKSYQEPSLAGVFSSYQVNVPQIAADIDRTKAQQQGINLADLNETMQVYLGSLYANDFNRFGRTYEVNVQADTRFRLQPEDLLRLQTRNAAGEMVPLSSVVTLRESFGPDRVAHYNGYVTAEINGGPAPGFSSGQAQAAIERIVESELAGGMSYEWTDLAYQEILAGNTALLVFPLCILLAFLVLAAQYESWTLPLVVVLIVPMCLLSALAGVWLAGGDNNVFTQIGLVVLVGLACKNAILIVEFARDKEAEGLPVLDAVLEACRLRLRPILMTSLAFIMGVIPLAISTGAGAEMRRAIGSAVLSGMLGVTVFGLMLTPVFYVFARRKRDKPPRPTLAEDIQMAPAE